MERVEATKVCIEAMRMMQDAWLQAGRAEVAGEVWRTDELGLVCVSAKSPPPGIKCDTDLDVVAYEIEIREDDQVARITYRETTWTLNDLAWCAWNDLGEDDQVIADALGLPLWSPAWHSERERAAQPTDER